MYKIRILNEADEVTYEASFDEVFIREAKGLETSWKKDEVVSTRLNGKHSCELKLWSGSPVFSLEELNTDKVLEEV